MIVPVAIGAPAVAVFIPPAMVVVPTAFAGFAQLMASVVRLPAVPAMVFDGFVQFVVGFRDVPLTATVVVSVNPWCGRECQQANQGSGCEHRASQELLGSRVGSHVVSILP